MTCKHNDNARGAARVLVGVAFALGAAGGGATAVAQTAMQITTGGVTGTYYMIAAPLANFINENSKMLRLSPSTSGGGFENLRRVEAGQAQFGMTQPETMSQAWNGEKPFDKQMRSWRVIGVVTPPMANHVIALKTNNIHTASDLKGQTFAIGAPGSGSTMAMSLFLDHVGMKNDVRIRMEGHQDYPSQLLDGKIQAFSRLGSVPAAVVDEVAASRAINLVDFGPELERSRFLDKYPFYQKVVVKAGTYKGQDKDVTLFGNAGFLIAHKDVPNEIVYEFTRLAYSDGAISKVGMAFKGSNLNRANPLEGNIGPVHPGAAKFWNELGVKVPAAALK
ncbi:MAG: TAXI family TRAP transporter solute-binding subunit [Burkholderiaceae bacterium]|nr:TAXI family TRAP transporter solute-binding subunit [Burkholderiaceae bacterium]